MSKKKKVLIAAIVALLILLTIVSFDVVRNGTDIYNYNANMATNERTSDQVLTSWLSNDKNFSVSAFRSKFKTEEIKIESSEGNHNIPATYIYAPGNTDKKGNTVIMIHGLLGNRLSNYPMSQLFLKNGYNVITYDQRTSGGNLAKHTTFGYLECKDTMDYIKYARKNMDSSSKLGLWGQSMGAATLQNAMDEKGFREAVSFAILDSPLGNMEDMIVKNKNGILGKLEIMYASFLSKKNLGFYYKDQEVYPQIENTTVPVLVVSSKADQNIPFELQQKIYKAIKESNKKMYTVEDSNHSNIYFDHPDDYQFAVDNFLKTIK